MTTLPLIKSIGRSPSRLALLLSVLVLVCFAVSQRAQAVSPPPDGGYPNFTTAEGTKALQSLTTGSGNTAVGWYSLFSDTTGSFNTGVGAGALALNTAENNTATGAAALLLNTTGSFNTANGAFALFSNTEGSGNTGNGYQALFSNQTGTLNTATGYQALVFSTTGDRNTASGYYSLRQNTQGFSNTAIGYQALVQNTTGHDNTALGDAAGAALTTGSGNIYVGHPGANAESNTIRIGITGFHTSTFIGGIAGQTVGAGQTTCYVDNDGKLGVFPSARRFKTDIADMGDVSGALLAMRPVTFHYKPELDKTGIPQFGLIAEEVAKVNPDLVTHDAKGELSTVRYEAVNAMLLNEFLKEHRKNEEQQKQIDVLTEQLKEQAAQIQKVSAQLEASRPAPQVVNNP